MDYAWEWLISAPHSGASLGKTRGLEELELREPLFFHSCIWHLGGGDWKAGLSQDCGLKCLCLAFPVWHPRRSQTSHIVA